MRVIYIVNIEVVSLCWASWGSTPRYPI